jgi:hypothetical protein
VLTYNIRHGQGIDGKIDLTRTAAVISACAKPISLIRHSSRRTLAPPFSQATSTMSPTARQSRSCSRPGSRLSRRWSGLQTWTAGLAILAGRRLSRPTLKTIGVISDTHGLLRPEALVALQGSDLLVHAGDIGSPDVIETLRDLAPVFAVRGNVDRGLWATCYPKTQMVEVEDTLPLRLAI